MAPLSPSTPAQIAGLLLSPLAGWSSLRFGSEHLHSPYTVWQSVGQVSPLASFNKGWLLWQPAPSPPLLCSSLTSPPAHPHAFAQSTCQHPGPSALHPQQLQSPGLPAVSCQLISVKSKVCFSEGQTSFHFLNL